MISIIGIALLGWFVYLLLEFYILDQSTKGISKFYTVKTYININFFPITASFIFLIVMSFFLTTDLKIWLLNTLSIGVLNPDKFSHVQFFAFAYVGLGNAALLIIIRKLVSPRQLDIRPLVSEINKTATQ